MVFDFLKRNRSVFAFSLLVVSLGSVVVMTGCGPTKSGDDSAIEFLGSVQATLKVGDTLTLSKATVKRRDAQGRLVTQSDYTSFRIVSLDTTVLRVSNDQDLIAVKAGKADIFLDDKNSALTSDKRSITVE